MDFTFTADEVAFREEARTFFAMHPPAVAGDRAGRRDYRRLLGECGWLTVHWPVAYGGRGAGHMQQVIFKEESFRAGVEAGNSGVNMVGPTLMLHGTDEQRRE